MNRRRKIVRMLLRWPLALAAVFVVVILIIGAAAYATIGGSSPATSSSVNLQKGLVGWWKMDGNAKDSTPYSANGTVTGTAAVADRVGKANGALTFNGTSDVVSVGNPSQLQITGSQTISMWLKPASLNARRNPYAKAYGGEGTITQEINGDLNYYYGTGGGNNTPYQGFTSAQPIAVSTWSHIVLVRDLTAMTLTWYINGVQRGQMTASYASAVASSLPATVGQGYVSNYDGSIDDVRVYNRAISPSEVAALYGQYDPAVKAAAGENGLIGWWKFAGNYKDSTPLANNLTVNGTTFTADRKGRASSALSSNDTSDYVYGQIGNGTYFGGNNALTVSAWVYVTATSSGPIFGMTAAPPGGGWNMPFLSLNGTTIYGWIYNNTPISTSATANQWHHVAMTYNPSGSPTTILYLDGQQAGTATGTYAAGGANYFTTYLSGAKPNAGVANYLNTPISDVRAYSRTLSAPEIANMASSYNSQVAVSTLQQGLVGDWLLNGNAKDATPYSNHATVSVATGTTDRKGQANSAYSFNGSNAYIQTASSATLSSGAFTASAWFKTSSGGDQKIISTGSSYHQLQTLGGNLRICVNGCTAGSTNVADGNWHLATVVGDGTSIRAYLDGNTTPEITQTAATLSMNGLLCIGAVGNNVLGFYFNGSVDDVRIWKRALSQPEVTVLYQSYR